MAQIDLRMECVPKLSLMGCFHLTILQKPCKWILDYGVVTQSFPLDETLLRMIQLSKDETFLRINQAQTRKQLNYLFPAEILIKFNSSHFQQKKSKKFCLV